MAYALHRRLSAAGGVAASWPAIGAGVTAGIIGGLIMALISMIGNAMTGPGMWHPVRLIAATFYGDAALQGGAIVIIVGLITHVLVSAFAGAIFGLVVGSRWRAHLALGMGLVWGLVIWAVMTWIILPAANPIMYNHVTAGPGGWFFQHLIFGAALALTPTLAREFAPRPALPPRVQPPETPPM